MGLFASMCGSRAVVWMDGGIYWLGWAWGKAGNLSGNMTRGMGILNANEETDDTG